MATEDDRSDLYWLGGLVVVLAAIAAVTFPLLHYFELRRDKLGFGAPVAAHRMTTADGTPVIVVVEEVVHGSEDGPDTSHGRVDVVDATRGTLLARAIRVETQDCLPGGPDRLWCEERSEKDPHEHTLVERDLRSLEVTTSEAQFAASVPEARAFGRTQAGTVDSETVDGRTYEFAGPSRKLLSIRGVSGKSESTIGSKTFLEPGFLVNSDTEFDEVTKALVVEGNVLFVVHQDSLDRRAAKTMLSAVDTAGNLRWTAEIGKGTIIGAWRIHQLPESIVVAVRADEGWLVALDPKTGQVRWRYAT
ncbi:hypothetical protein AKJ09_08070 [Labilithrix luteola]|uniref:Uncharacterized protein n=1 Tax=Labilithrix luteola TaxID=1391654 RepID=A0A0K1Q6X7_9BACT|nr:hypothetical protein [Labilithrix luteola]AKV01407.1 hypothetical protein AKJ09_08070 [Labilithrix luteola]